MSEIAFIALGSNLGDRESHLRFAREAIARLPDTRIVAVSDLEETAPLGGLPQPPYLNQMLAVETERTPESLLLDLQRIELARGRTRGERWASRTLDLDIVRFDDLRLATEALTLPHPGLVDRDFWQRQIGALEASLGDRS
jgi:2-amino-4-hydroxy-6-hydroxymethyldihydropteridine diphosphokinase